MPAARVFATISLGALMSLSFLACGPDERAGGPHVSNPDLAAGAILDFSTGEPLPVPDLAQPVSDVHVVLTADNAYAFGWGDATQVASLKGRPPTATAGDIFNCPIGTGPEVYDVPGAEAPPDAYLYVVTWDDNSVTEGVIGQFERGGQPIYTGDAAWEACATGLPYNPSTGSSTANGPTQQVINEQIAKCNAGTISTTTGSGGWVSASGAVTANAVGKLAVGEDNSDQSGTFPIVCQKDANNVGGVDAAAHWMWYLAPGQTDAFHSSGGTNPTRAFLLFRLKSESVPIL